MDQDDGQETELERELDQMYRKVAGNGPPEGAPMRKDTGVDLQAVAEAISAAEQRARGKPRAAFRIAPIVKGLLSAAIVIAIALAAFFYWVPDDRQPTVASGGGAVAPAKNRPPGEGAILKDKEGRSYPLPPEAVVLKLEDVMDPFSAAPTAATATAHKRTGASRARPQGRYAVQIRAYPEDEKQKAIAFLEELRKRNPDASLETVSLARRGVWHRILLGDFANKEEADEGRLRRGVFRDYPHSFVQKKSGALRESKSP